MKTNPVCLLSLACDVAEGVTAVAGYDDGQAGAVGGVLCRLVVKDELFSCRCRWCRLWLCRRG